PSGARVRAAARGGEFAAGRRLPTGGDATGCRAGETELSTAHRRVGAAAARGSAGPWLASNGLCTERRTPQRRSVEGRGQAARADKPREDAAAGCPRGGASR